MAQGFSVIAKLFSALCALEAMSFVSVIPSFVTHKPPPNQQTRTTYVVPSSKARARVTSTVPQFTQNNLLSNSELARADAGQDDKLDTSGVEWMGMDATVDITGDQHTEKEWVGEKMKKSKRARWS